MEWSNQVVLVTGASKGLGKEVAVYFGRLGAKVVCAARNATELEVVAQSIRSNGGLAVAVATDVTNNTSVATLVNRALEVFGSISILINCVGSIGPTYDLLDYLDESDWDVTLATNLKSVFLMCRYVVPIMKKQRYGKIINITINIDDRVEKGLSPYYAAKAGVTYLTRQLACELKPFNVQANCLNPGGLKTDLTSFWEKYPDSDALARIGKTQYVPFQDRLRDIAELLPTFCFLASSDSDPITGAYFTISSKVEPMYLCL